MSNFVWSYTALDIFEQCPKKFFHQYILKEKAPASPKMQRGRDIHLGLENYVKGNTVKDPQLIERFLPLADAVVQNAKGKKLYTELKMGLNGIMEPVGFFDDHVWGRGAADVVLIDYPNAMLIDWKDGKEDKSFDYIKKWEKPTQLAILSLFLFKHFPKIDKVTSCNVWLEHGQFGKPYTLTRAMEPALWGAIMPKIEAVERAIALYKQAASQAGFTHDRPLPGFPMITGPLCGYCDVKSCPNNRS